MPLEILTDPQLWIALLTLSTLEIVLGVDNLVFIAIAVGRLPEERRSRARRFGIALACVTRIGLLLVLAHLARMDDTHAKLFSAFGQVISIRDVILIGGGLFLLVKGTMEIHDTIYKEAEVLPQGTPGASFLWIILQIAVIDIVFSLDSVITAVGMVRNIPVMVAAIVLAVIVMLFAANPVGNFIDRHPPVRMLALAFILLVGVALIAEGSGVHIQRGYIYVAMAFSAVVEILNMWARREWTKRHQRREGDHPRIAA
ncbi:MAG TPA: TerC family protein [Rudaea sp.]|nr:TerC family protein [Rudaea sp.]